MMSTSKVTPSSPSPKEAKQTEQPIAKLVSSAIVTITFEACLGGHYLEMLKILKQTTSDPYPVITRRMMASKGMFGLLDGFIPWGALQASVKGGSFGYGHALFRKLLLNATFLEDWQQEILAGGGGGLIQGMIMSPTLLLKTRVMTDPRFRTTGGLMSTGLHSLRLGGELIRTEGGLMSLTKGMGVFSFKRFCDWTTRYGFVVAVEEIYKSKIQSDTQYKLSKLEQMGCSLTGGTLSALVTVPIDVTVAIIQQNDKKGQKVSVVEIYSNALKAHGTKGVIQMGTRGLFARVAHVAFTVMMMKNVSSWLYSYVVNR